MSLAHLVRSLRIISVVFESFHLQQSNKLLINEMEKASVRFVLVGRVSKMAKVKLESKVFRASKTLLGEENQITELNFNCNLFAC